MYILQNALKNLRRNIGRNIMIAVIIFAIIVTTVVSLIINNTSAAVIDDYRNKFGSEVELRLDIQRLQEEMMAGMSAASFMPESNEPEPMAPV